jgi:regulatory protein
MISVTEKSLMDEALKYLSRQSYSEQRLSDKLIANGFSEVEISECFTRLKQWGYLDDREFGINRIQQLQERLKSRSFVISDLEGHGLAKNLLTELIDSCYPEEAETEIARKLLLKKGSTGKNQTKMWIHLVRVGFSENTVRHCFPSIDPT